VSHAYRLISADTHVNEPPDLWTSRVAARFRERVPRIERYDEGDEPDEPFGDIGDKPRGVGVNARVSHEPREPGALRHVVETDAAQQSDSTLCN